MSGPDPVLRGGRVVTPEGLRPASVHVRGGRIEAVAAFDDVPAGSRPVELGDAVLMPGLVATHVHVNDPGRADWEGFGHATRAAAAGGVTTLVDMPLNSIPPTTTAYGLRAKLEAARGRCFVDVGFWGGVVPGNLDEIGRLHAAGVPGFKCFLVDSGVDEFPAIGEPDLAAALREVARLDSVLLAHAELPGPIEAARAAVPPPGAEARREYATWLAARPAAAEEEAVGLLRRLAREAGVRVHVVHLSAAGALPMLKEARAAGVAVTVETCPHYLYFAAEEVPAGATEFKCAPPIRGRANADALWRGLEEGTIDMVVSDHSPAPAGRKARDSGDFLEAWGGIASLQLRLPVVWTAARRRGLEVDRLADWLCRAPAGLAGLGRRKGRLAPGLDADLVVWRPEAEFTVEPDRLFHRHPLTPYAGETLVGGVEATYLRGRLVYHRGRFPGGPAGRLLHQEPR